MLLFWRFCQGLCTPGVFSVTVAYINDEWASGGAGAVLSSYVSGTVLGGFSCRLIAWLAPSPFWLAMGFHRTRRVSAGRHRGDRALKFKLTSNSTRITRRSGRVSWFAAVASHLKNRRLQPPLGSAFCFVGSVIFTLITFLSGRAALQPGARLDCIYLLRVFGGSCREPRGGARPRPIRTAHGAGLRDRSGQGASALTPADSLWMIGLGLTICSSGVFAATTPANNFVGAAAVHNRSLAVGLYAAFYYIGGGLGAAIRAHLWSLGGLARVRSVYRLCADSDGGDRTDVWKGPVRAGVMIAT